jgi:hypothetical protein
VEGGGRLVRQKKNQIKIAPILGCEHEDIKGGKRSRIKKVVKFEIP